MRSLETTSRCTQNYARKFWQRLAAALWTWRELRIPVISHVAPIPGSRPKISTAFHDVSEDVGELTNSPSFEQYACHEAS
jgi:hypothetical protein